MPDDPKPLALSLAILGKASAAALYHATDEDAIAQTFDVVCKVLAQRMTPAQQQTVDSFTGLDISKPWNTHEDYNRSVRRSVEQRRKPPTAPTMPR